MGIKWTKLIISAVAVFLVSLTICRHISIPPQPWKFALASAGSAAFLQLGLGGYLIKVWRKDGN